MIFFIASCVWVFGVGYAGISGLFRHGSSLDNRMLAVYLPVTLVLLGAALVTA